MHYIGMKDKANKLTFHQGATTALKATLVEFHFNLLSTTLGLLVDNYKLPLLTFSLEEANKTDIDESHQRPGIQGMPYHSSVSQWLWRLQGHCS